MRSVTAPAALLGILVPVTFVSASEPAGSDAGSHGVARLARPAALAPIVESSDPVQRRGVDAFATEPLTRDERDLVAWVYARFALVGLDVPPVDITFHDDTESCGGSEGRFRGAGEQREVAVCVRDTGAFASQLHRQRTLVHELAHAWDHANFDSDDRADLLPTLDAADWYAPGSDWHERGIERFAETIVWGLYDQLRRPVRIDVPCRELHADFRAITGFTAPGPLEGVCDPSPAHPIRSRGRGAEHG